MPKIKRLKEGTKWFVYTLYAIVLVFLIENSFYEKVTFPSLYWLNDELLFC